VNRNQSRFRFSLRTLLVLVAAAGFVSAWIRSACQQRDSVAALRASDPAARLLYGYEVASSGRGLRRVDADRWDRVRKWLSPDYLSNVSAIELHYATDDELRLVAQFRGLTQLFLWRSVDVTDQGLARLGGLGRLKTLVVADANNVTDAGVTTLAKLSSLEELSYSAGPRVTAQGILQLAALGRLKRLEVSCYNPDAAAAIDELRRLLPDCRIVTPGEPIL
jgi:phosphotransferase system HPr-like phosphotransfer protein